MALGAAAGGAEALMEIIQQKLRERAQIAHERHAGQQLQQQGAYQRESLGLQQRSADRADESARVLNEQRQAAGDRQAAQDAALAAQEATAGHQAKLRASIQGSQNLAGSDDPMGAPATRNALRVALTSSGAKDNEIPQEKEQPKPKLHAVTVPGSNGQPMHKLVTEEALQQGVQGYKAPTQGPAPKDTSSLAMRLADDYTRDSKDYTTMNQAMRRVVASANNPSAAGDMALLYSYMKILDPGSVVRETEFATAAQSGSLPQQIQGAASKLLSGQRLTPEQRADFVNRAQALYAEAKSGNKTVRESYTQRAQKFGVDPSMVFTDIGEPELPAGGGGTVAMVAPDGRALSVPAADVERMLSLGAKRKQ